MIITNKQNLEPAIVRAVEQDEYSSGADVSITGLTASPRIHWLKKRHADEITVDVSDRIFALMGRAIHHILDKYNPEGTLTEHRLFADIAGWKVSGAPDVMTPEKIQDWKSTSVWTVIFDANKEDYVLQLNGYRYLAMFNKLPIPAILENILILRDWSMRKASRDAGYPQHQVEKVQQKVMAIPQIKEFIDGRVALFQGCDGKLDTDLPMCTAVERWYKGDKFAVMKKGRKTAIKVCDTLNDAELLVRQGYKGATHTEQRKTENVRCEHYCECRMFCDYYNEVVAPAGAEDVDGQGGGEE